jgi:hypothetical protein
MLSRVSVLTRHLLGIIFLAIPLGFQLLWIWVFSLHSSHEQRVLQYKGFLPPLLKDPKVATLFFFLCCIASIVFMATGVTQKSLWGKILSVFVMIVAGLLGLLLVFSLM